MQQIDREDKTSRTTFRLLVGAAAAALLATAGLTTVLLGGDDEPDVNIPKGTTSTTTKATPGSIRDVDFRNFTFANPCPTAGVPVTMMDGAGSTPGNETDKGFSAGVEPVSYVDVDHDGTEEAVVPTFCFVQMQEVATAAVGVYGVDPDGKAQLVGTQLEIERITDRPQINGTRVTASTYTNPDLSSTQAHSWSWDAEAKKFVENHPVGTASAIRDVDFRNRTYARPCPSIKDADITFDSGAASLGDENFRYVAEVAVGSYGDFDNDGAEDDALVVIFCHHQAAESAAAWAAVYTVGGDGQPQLVGTPLEIPDGATLPYEAPTVDGNRLTVKMEYSDKPDDLPDDSWVFDGSRFVKQ